MPITYVTTYACPLGTLTLESDGRALTRVRLPNEPPPPVTAVTRNAGRAAPGSAVRGARARGGTATSDSDGDARILDAKPFATVIAQLDEYFAGARRKFDLPLAPRGTPFQLKVWRELRKIPYGRTITYATLARRAGNEAACRAVGAANGRNPLPIVVPCHRVLGSDGSLTGFGGGIDAKRALLQLEGAWDEE